MRPLLELRRTGGDRPQYPVGREDLISDASFLQKATLSGQGRILLPLRLEELLNHLCRPSHCHRRNSKVYPTLHDLRCPLHLLHLLRAVPGPDHLESQQSRRACSPDRESRLWRILASSSPPVGRRTDDDEHVSFEVPSGDRGRLRVSLAWLRGVGNRLDRKLPPLPPQPVASLPPVPPKSPSRSSGDRTRFTGAQDPSERASSSIPPSQADRPGELWYDPLYNMATRPTYPAGMYPMQTQPFAYPQPAMHFTPWNSHPHLMQPVPSAHPPGPVSINPPSTIVSPNFPQVPLHPPKGASYHPVSMMPVTNGGYPYPPLPRPPSMWRRMIGSQPAHDDPLRARRRQVPTGRAPTLVPPLVRPVRERPISPSRMNRFGGYTKYHRAPGPLRQLFTRRNDADRFLERQRQRRDPTMNYNLGRSRSYPVGQDANANSSRADGLFRPHSFAAGQIPRIDAQRQRERDSFAVREKEERRKQKATRRDEREARRSQRDRADRATEDNHRGVRTMVGDWMTRFRAAGRKDESRGRNGMNVIPWG